MTSLKRDEKLSEVLELFLLPNYNVVSTSYLDLLLTHISENIKESKKVFYLISIISCFLKSLILQVTRTTTSTANCYKNGY